MDQPSCSNKKVAQANTMPFTSGALLGGGRGREGFKVDESRAVRLEKCSACHNTNVSDKAIIGDRCLRN
jgi:hypothetical protein